MNIDDYVCMNTSPKAAVFRITKVEGFSVGLVDASMACEINQRVQWVDKSMPIAASTKQLEHLERCSK